MITRALMMKKCKVFYIIVAGRMIIGRKKLNPMKSEVFFTLCRGEGGGGD